MSASEQPVLTSYRKRCPTDHSVNSSYDDNTNHVEKIVPKRQASGLKTSLLGSPSILLPIWVLLVSSSYGQLANHPDPAMRGLVIKSESTSNDIRKMNGVVAEFEAGLTPHSYCDGYDRLERGLAKAATAGRVLKALKSRKTWACQATLIYLALHRHDADGEQPGFKADDYSEDIDSGPKNVILDSQIRDTIMKYLVPGAGPLLLFTEACNTGNIVQLPYFIELIDDVVHRQEIEECKNIDWGSRPFAVHISATTPAHEAALFEGGAVCTLAFNNSFKKPLTLEGLLKAMQAEVDQHLLKKGNGGTPLSQRLRIYYSQPEVLEASTLWSFMNFQLKPDLLTPNHQEAI